MANLELELLIIGVLLRHKREELNVGLRVVVQIKETEPGQASLW